MASGVKLYADDGFVYICRLCAVHWMVLFFQVNWLSQPIDLNTTFRLGGQK